MSDNEIWCREKLANLKIKDLQLTTLNEIKNHLVSSEDAKLTSNILQLEKLYDCLEAEESR